MLGSVDVSDGRLEMLWLADYSGENKEIAPLGEGV
jgi:hypothetical protein